MGQLSLGFVLPALHQAVGADLPRMSLCSAKSEKEPTKTQIKIQKLIKYKGIHLINEKCREYLTEPKCSMADQVTLL